MVVERFSRNLINTGIFKLYVAIGFCATLIFFILNSDRFAPIEMVFGAVFVTVVLKGASNVIFSYIVKNFSLEQKVEDFNTKYSEEKISFLLNQFRSEDYIDEDETDEVKDEILVNEEAPANEELKEEIEEDKTA